MNENLTTLKKYFPTGTTEGERHILKRAFVGPSELSEIITPPPSSPRILIGKKGSGKSAIIDFLMALAEKAKVPALHLKPLDMDYGGISDSAAVGELTKIAYTTLTIAIARKLGETQTGFISASDSSLYEEAIRAGLTERDTIGKLARLLPKLAKPYTTCDFSSLLPTQDRASLQKLESSIQENLAQSKNGFYLFIDDTDQVAAPDKSGHLNRIWGFLLATRELTQVIPELRCIVTFREEVWRRLTTDRAGQRDQTDHFSTLTHYLHPTREHVREIVERRVMLAAEEALTRPTKLPWDEFFEGHSPRIPSSEERSSWHDLIVVRSRERPRDAVQLINALCEAAIIDSKTKIDENIFAKVMPEFSRQRAILLAQEAEQECPVIDPLMRTFSDLNFDYGSFKLTNEALRKHLSAITGFSITLYGRILQLSREDDLISLWRYLYEIGFINARLSDKREKDGFRHVYPHMDPSLVSKARWNDMQSAIWEIGPAYRDYLISIQKEHASKTGLAPSFRKSTQKRGRY